MKDLNFDSVPVCPEVVSQWHLSRGGLVRKKRCIKPTCTCPSHPSSDSPSQLSLSAVMPSNTAASMFGGAGGRGSRASVASLQGLRNVMRNDTERDSAAPKQEAPTAAAAPPPPAPAAPADDKQTLRGLNDRLSGYLGRVRQLEKENGDLEKQIDDILAKRKAPEGRDWDEVEKPLEDLKKKVGDEKKQDSGFVIRLFNIWEFPLSMKCDSLSSDQRHHHG